MLTQVDVRNEQGALLMLPLQDTSAGYVVKEVHGLDPVKATITSSTFAMLDGAQYQSSRRETRNIIIVLGLSPDYNVGSVQDLRNRLYAYFMPKSSVNLSFIKSDAPTVTISGRIETCETSLFTKDPEMMISILCFDPDFYDANPITVAGNTISGTTEMLIDYQGSVETGIIFRLNLNRSLSEFTLHNRPPDGTLRDFEFAAALISGDILELNMIPGFKSATRIRTGVASSVLYGVAPFANWIKLYPGFNYIRVYATGLAIPYTIEYTNKFGGL